MKRFLFRVETTRHEREGEAVKPETWRSKTRHVVCDGENIIWEEFVKCSTLRWYAQPHSTHISLPPHHFVVRQQQHTFGEGWMDAMATASYLRTKWNFHDFGKHSTFDKNGLSLNDCLCIARFVLRSSLIWCQEIRGKFNAEHTATVSEKERDEEADPNDEWSIIIIHLTSHDDSPLSHSLSLSYLSLANGSTENI